MNQSQDDKAKEMDEMSKLLQMHKAHVSELQNQLGSSKLGFKAHDTHHLTIGIGEGLFEIHMECLQLSPEALRSLLEQVRHSGLTVDVKMIACLITVF
jgi:hypothetical protein